MTRKKKGPATFAETSHSEQQAKAQLESILEMVTALDTEDEEEREDAQNRIQEDPLSIEVRSGWHVPGTNDADVEGQYTILLCTGGPACRIIGNLDRWKQPETARIEHQDWGTPWTEYRLDSEEEKAVLTYAQQFYFGE